MRTMRAVHWLFVVSVALFVAGIGFVVAAGRTAQAGAPVEAQRLTPVASIKQIMNGIVAPSATVVYGAVGTVISADGIKETAPQNDEEWAVVGNSAAALMESGNLLMMEGRAIDSADWIKMSQAMIDAAGVALKASEAKSTNDVLESGQAINESCDTCHARYQRQ